MRTIGNSSFWDNAYKSALQMAKSKLDEQDQFWVEDIAQNAIMKAFLQFEKFDSTKGNFTTWLLTITKNLCFDFMKRKEKVVFKREEMGQYSDLIDDGVEMKIVQENQLLTLEKSLSLLNEKDQKMIVMKYYQNASSRDISKEIQIPEANIPVYMKRAKLKLHEKMIKISA
jgi:RNA polymerase sigma factor (sigma-70 family)